MKNKKVKKGTYMIVSGLILIVLALLLVFYNMNDDIRAGKSVKKTIEKVHELNIEPSGIDYKVCPDMDMPVVNIDGVDYCGTLYIPSYDLELPVINDWSYPNLRIAPCRYKGSAYTKDLIIAAHNYKTHFGNLSHLVEGDEIIFTDMDENKFTYRVLEVEFISGSDVPYMEDGDWDLTLFTCNLSGRQRITVRCIDISDFQNLTNI